jgi:hypothetical protein
MAARTDVRLSPTKTCEIVGVSLQQRQSLIGRGLLPRESAGGCSIVDALLLAGLTALSERLSPSEAAVAWPPVREALAGSVPGPRLDVVFHIELGQAAIVRDDAALCAAVSHGRPVRVLELGPRLDDVADAFRRWAAAAPARGRRVRRGSSAQRKTS